MAEIAPTLIGPIRIISDSFPLISSALSPM